jgi:hypothetical protein
MVLFFIYLIFFISKAKYRISEVAVKNMIEYNIYTSKSSSRKYNSPIILSGDKVDTVSKGMKSRRSICSILISEYILLVIGFKDSRSVLVFMKAYFRENLIVNI